MPEPLPVFVERRRQRWDELATLVETARGRVARLPAPSVRLLGRRYREAVADLAQARRRFPGDPVTTSLERLVHQARPLVYGTPTERGSVAHFATTGYWQRVRERPLFLLVAAVALFAPTLAIGAWAHAHPSDATRVAQVSPLTAGLADRGPRNPDTEKVTATGTNAGLSAQIFTNNVRVALAAFAGALTGGVVTLVSLVFNGLVLGLVGGMSINGGYGSAMFRLILPHGVLELSLIVASGAAGFRTGWAMVHPGHRTRVEALVSEGRAGIEIALGSAALLVLSGLVEGFVTPRGLTLPYAAAVGLALGGVYWLLVWWRGRPTT